MKTNRQFLVIALSAALVTGLGLGQAAARVTSDSVTFAKPEAKKPAPPVPAAPPAPPAPKVINNASPKTKAPAKAVPDKVVKDKTKAGHAKAGRDYDQCLALVESDAHAALSYARDWQISLPQGSLAGRHCEALALSSLGRYHDAAVALSEVALTMDNNANEVPKEARAGAYAQAADAWSLANDDAKALTAIDQALALDPEADYLMTRANINALAKKWNDVRIDTGKVLAALPTDAEALALRAVAYRNLGALEAALEDANHAVEIAPHNLTALLERGRIKAAMHDMTAARVDWQQVVKFATATGQKDDPRAVAAQAILDGGDGTK